MPSRFEVLHSKQPDLRRQELLLNRKQRGQLHIARMQLNLDDRAVENLEFDKAKVLNGERGCVVIGIGIAQCREKLGAVLDHPLPV